jgi:hypothetical protein
MTQTYDHLSSPWQKRGAFQRSFSKVLECQHLLLGKTVPGTDIQAHILDISRETSHRFEETISWLKNQE